MKVVVVDPKKSLNYVDVVYELVRLDSLTQMAPGQEHEVDILVLCDIEPNIGLINSVIKENVWKIYVHKDLESSYPLDEWREFSFVELIQSDFDFTKLKSLEDSTALISNKINFKEKFDFNSKENQKLQSAINEVFKDDEGMSMSSDDSGLKIKMPSAVNENASKSLNISLDLGEDSGVHDEVNTEAKADDSGLDMGDLDASALSLSSGDESQSEIQAPVEQDRPGDLDFEDTSVPDIGFHAKGEILEAVSTDVNTDIDVNEDNDSLVEKLEESISDLDGIDEFSDLDLSADVDDNDLDLSADGVGDLDDDLGGDLDGGLDDLDDDFAASESTGKTQITSQNDLDEINQKMGSKALEDDDIIEQKSQEFGDALDDNEKIGTDTFNKSINTLLGIKAPAKEAQKVEEESSLKKQLPKQPPSFQTLAKADETGEIDISSLLGNSESENNVTKNIHNVSDSKPEEVVRSQVASENYASVNSNYSANDLLDIKITLSELKDDRKNLLDEITQLEHDKDQLIRQNLNLKADLDELKIELSIMKKRHIAEMEDYKQQNAVLHEKREILEAKNKNYQREIERLGSKIRIDFSKIKQREKELEGQLELITIDAESKVKSRDLKILELKRKIDSLEFNMENITIKEKQSIHDKNSLEEKLNRVVGTLRNSLSLLEQDIDIEEITKSLKKESDF